MRDWDSVTRLINASDSTVAVFYQHFRKELFAALKILDDGHIRNDRMMGSWAGAMGQPQFMPTSYLSYAVDFDGDGKRDIWTNRGDVFASIANYLARSGWLFRYVRSKPDK